MATRRALSRITLLVGPVIAGLLSARAAEVTSERLLNPDREPQNWLMNHRTYDGQRFSPLSRINKDNVQGLRLAYAVPLGHTADLRSAFATARKFISARERHDGLIPSNPQIAGGKNIDIMLAERRSPTTTGQRP
jgi:hypothetical protein